MLRRPVESAGAKQTPPSFEMALRRRCDGRWCGCPRPSRRYASPMTDVFPRIRTVATGERSKALQGVVPVSVMGSRHLGETTQATD